MEIPGQAFGLLIVRLTRSFKRPVKPLERVVKLYRQVQALFVSFKQSIKLKKTGNVVVGVEAYVGATNGCTLVHYGLINQTQE